MLKHLQNVDASDAANLFTLEMDIPDELDEFEAYLLAPRVPVKDPLKHWHGMLPSPLARMALDILTAPGTQYIILLSY